MSEGRKETNRAGGKGVDERGEENGRDEMWGSREEGMGGKGAERPGGEGVEVFRKRAGPDRAVRSASSLAAALDAQSGESPSLCSLQSREAHSVGQAGAASLASQLGQWGLGWGEWGAGPHWTGAVRCHFISELLPACRMGYTPDPVKTMDSFLLAVEP